MYLVYFLINLFEVFKSSCNTLSSLEIDKAQFCLTYPEVG